MTWQVYDAKARFSEFLEATLKDGPQILTRRGIETAVLVPIAEWKHLKETAKKAIPDPLLDPKDHAISLWTAPGPQAPPFPFDDEEQA